MPPMALMLWLEWATLIMKILIEFVEVGAACTAGECVGRGG
jgi:hypothetical protein